MKLKTTIEKDIDINKVLDMFEYYGGDPYDWWDNYESVLDSADFDNDTYSLLKRNPKSVLKACLLLYADKLADYAEKDLEKEIDTFRGNCYDAE